MADLERANGHRPEGLEGLQHPALKSAPRPDPEALDYDLDARLDAVMRLTARVPDDAFTAMSLGTQRDGSGIVIDEDGLILTIGYLIAEATEITLTRRDGTTFEAVPAAYDHETGFGMVRLTDRPGAMPIPFGNPADTHEGHPVVVASYGGMGHAIDARLMSRRPFAGSWEYMLAEAFYTVPMHPYWGGSAMLDKTGSLIGVGSLYIEEARPGEGISPGNMFVPIDLLDGIYEAMVQTGRADRKPRPWLGMQAGETADRLVVVGVSTSGPADTAGIEAGDEILSLEGEPVDDLQSLYTALWKGREAGDLVRLTVLRDDDVLNIRVLTGNRYEFLNLPRRH